MARLYVDVATHIDAGPMLARHNQVIIPPDYDEADTRALQVRMVEDTAFELIREEFGREPTRRALLAATARLKALEDLYPEIEAGSVRERIREILEATNDEAIEQWGETPEGG
jgi:hypothetical protein